MNAQPHKHALPPELIHTALQDAPDAMLIVDTTGMIRFANQAVTGMPVLPRVAFSLARAMICANRSRPWHSSMAHCVA